MFIVLFQSQNKNLYVSFRTVIVLTGFFIILSYGSHSLLSLDYNFSLVFISLSLSPEEVSCSYLSCTIRILIRIRGSVFRGIRLSTVTGKGGSVGLKLAKRVNLLSKDKMFYTKGRELN